VRYYFTEEDHLTRVRGVEIRAALVHARHDVIHGRPGAPAPRDAEVWMHGLGIDGGPVLEESLVRQLLDSHAEIVLFQLCDAESMSFSRIPESLAARTRLFLRNHWPKDQSRIPEAFRSRLGWLPPMIKQMGTHAGLPLADRSGGAIFYGTRTGFANLSDGKNAREETVRRMRASGLPFVGGLSPHAEARYHAAPDLVVPRMHEREHAKLLRDARICLAPWGNHPITYRLFEGLALRCLVVAQSIRATAFLDGGLEAGRHYVEVADDLSDLVDKVRHYLANLPEAQRIADAGHEHFERHFASRGSLVSSWIFEGSVASWGDLYRQGDGRGVFAASRALAARLFAERF
jgi:glycosyltransferase involved in cell wall biosynthesis